MIDGLAGKNARREMFIIESRETWWEEGNKQDRKKTDHVTILGQYRLYPKLTQSCKYTLGDSQ